MARPKVLLTNPIGPEGIQIIEQVADVVVAPDTRHETLLECVRDADALLVRAYLPQNIFDVARRLRGVVRYAVGLDMIPMEAATAKSIPVANMPGVNSEAVAEYAVSGLLMLARRMHRMNHLLRTVDWNTSRALGEKSSELLGRTIGIVGVGNIGGRLAEICHTGFRMRVLGHQRRLTALPDFVTGVDIDTLCRESDYIALCCPLTEATRNLIMEIVMDALIGVMRQFIHKIGPQWDTDYVLASRRRFMRHLAARAAEAAVGEMERHLKRVNRNYLALLRGRKKGRNA